MPVDGTYALEGHWATLYMTANCCDMQVMPQVSKQRQKPYWQSEMHEQHVHDHEACRSTIRHVFTFCSRYCGQKQVLPADIAKADQASIDRHPAVLLLSTLVIRKVWHCLQLCICNAEPHVPKGHLKLEGKLTIEFSTLLQELAKGYLDLCR